MPISVTCPVCSAKLRAPDHLAGKRLNCPKCRTTLMVPGIAVPLAPPPIQAAEFISPSPPSPTDFSGSTLPPLANLGQSVQHMPCPFCAERIVVGAKKCRFCGEMLDPVIRAAEEHQRHAAMLQQVRPPRQDYHGEQYQSQPEQMPASYAASLFGGCLIVVLAIGTVIGVLFIIKSQQQKNDIIEANKLYDAGKIDEAIPKYKDGYPSATGEQQVSILRRVVDYEASNGNSAESRKWIERGLDDKAVVVYKHPAAMALFTQITQKREELAAKKQSEQETKTQAKKEQAAMPKKGVSRANYDKIQDGMTLDEVQEILGPGKEDSRAGNLSTVFWQSGGVMRGFKAISITFEDGRVASKAILD